MNKRAKIRSSRTTALAALICGLPAFAAAAPLAVGSCDDFEDGMGNWTVNASGGFAGINSMTASSPSNSMYLNGGVVDVESIAIDTTALSFAGVSVWVRRGWDTFSEDPDPREDLVLEYLDDLGNWTELGTFTGHSRRGQVWAPTYVLPANAHHSGFRLRFHMTGGSGAGRDYWHIDDVCLDQAFVPDLLVSKMVQPIADPVNGTLNPKAIPGATVRYTISVSNHGPGPVDSDSLVITDPLPAGAMLFVDASGSDPVGFVDGAFASGLSFSYDTDVSFSDQPGGGPPFDHQPQPDADGYDPAITGIRVSPSGLMNAGSDGDVPSFSVHWLVRID